MFFPKKVNHLIVTWFGSGLSPKAPGTVGSLAALPLCFLISLNDSLIFKILFAFGMSAIAVLACAQDQASGGKRDPGYAVIDEVVGLLWGCLLISKPDPLAFAVAFGLFRFFDIVKVWPASYFDKKSKTAASTFHRGFHIVFDDIVAGLYTLVLMAFFHLGF